MDVMFFRFANPGYFWFLLLIPVFLFFYHRSRHRTGIYYSVIEDLTSEKRNKLPGLIFHLLYYLKVFGFILVIFALARPQHGFEEKKIV
ncbi:MAG: BatA domain-containing protein, partial [bacterium]|nr:BatA domain-containing protein [bacterium]